MPRLTFKLAFAATHIIFCCALFVFGQQNAAPKIEIINRQIDIAGSNTSGLVIPVDLTSYEGGKYNITLTAEPGTGISKTKGKCWASWTWELADKFSTETRRLTLPPGQGYGFIRDFGPATKLMIGIYWNCGPDLKNKLTLTFSVTPKEAVKPNPSFPSGCQMAELNPANPGDGAPNFSDRSRNGQDILIIPPGMKVGNSELIYVNGIDTTFGEASNQGMQLARLSNRPVRLIYNNSSFEEAFAVASEHFGYGREPYWFEKPGAIRRRDVRDWVKTNALANPPVARKLASTVEKLIASGKDISVLAYSQGAAITKAAGNCVRPGSKAESARVFLVGGAAKVGDISGFGKVSGVAHLGDVVSQLFGDVDNLADWLNNSRNLEQHLNYLPGQSKAGETGDPVVVRRFKSWLGGADSGSSILPRYVQTKK